MNDIFDQAEQIADSLADRPEIKWVEIAGRDGRKRGFEIKRGKGLELEVEIYALDE